MKEDSSYDPGSVLLDRYRIVSLIGEGGMGEVYKADDLTLGQPVALKFLPAELVEREDLKRRFQHEVRIARQVTHRNVARVHDIAEVEGRPVLSMEYVDGEDLSQLLKQIGRLPREKALDIARQICAGLAAAHDAGVLHRDLKPANVLLDRAGKVHLTDFGLAGLADEEREGGVVGTPAYMAPEQITGGPMDVRSEVYSLGLLLYEVFTGKRAFDGRSFEELRDQHAQSTPLTPTSVIAEMDPAVERVILHCLEKDPDERPSSVNAVAWALPGGDPLAAALAAGETPPPELVAAAGFGTHFAPRVAVAWLAVVLAALAGMLAMSGESLVAKARPPLPPQVLAARARDVLALCGERYPAVDHTSGFTKETSFLSWVQTSDESLDRWDRIGEDGHQPVLFWYRESPLPLAPLNPATVGPAFRDPPHDVPGMARMMLDANGRLRSFSVVPPRYDTTAEPHADPDWSGFFEAAELDPGEFSPVQPVWTPQVNSDRRYAWERAGEEDESPLRIEASSFRGRPNMFSVVQPWVSPPSAPAIKMPPLQIVGTTTIVVVLLGAALIARRNYRLGRGDMKGALRLALFVIVLRVLGWLVGAHHLPPVPEFNAFIFNLGMGCLVGGFVWAFYLALEPYFRRLWPQRLVSWVRALNGKLRDPLIGRDVLVGLTLGLVGVSLTGLYQLLAPAFGYPAPRPDLLTSGTAALSPLNGVRTALAVTLISFMGALTNGLIFSVVLLVLRLLLRLQILAAIGFVALFAFFSAPAGGYGLVDYGLGLVFATGYYLVLMRIGLLAAVLGTFTTALLSSVPLTNDFSSWTASSTLLATAVLLGLAIYGFTTALGGQALFRDTLFERAHPS